jgi:hypothetical protein
MHEGLCRNLEADGLGVDHPVRGVGEFDYWHAMRPRCKTLDDQLAAGIHPMPSRIVKGDMHMADARCHIERSVAENGNDAKVVGMILDDDKAASQRLGKRRSDDEACWLLRSWRSDGRQVERAHHGANRVKTKSWFFTWAW